MAHSVICLSPLKFYDSLTKQERYKSYAYGHVSPLIMPNNVLQPFQFVIPEGTSSTIGDCLLIKAESESVVGNIKSSLVEAGLTVKGERVIFFPGVYPIAAIQHEGEYYLKIVVGGKEFFSEIMCFTNNTDDCLEIEYWNPETDFLIKDGIVTFVDNFHFKIFIKSELGKPEYGFEEEATKRLGYTYIESQLSKKTYKFNAVLPEYICDALRLVRLCSRKILRSKGEEYDMLTFEMEVEWQNQGDLASVTCEFDIDNIILVLGGFDYERLGGDFNADFNNDFNIQQ